MVVPHLVLLQYAAMGMYATIAVFALIGAVLYWGAFNEMKRTRIIASVAALMLALFVDASWWGLAEFSRFVRGEELYGEFFVSPTTLIIIKMFLAATTVGFVLNSVKKDKRTEFACHNENRQVKKNG